MRWSALIFLFKFATFGMAQGDTLTLITYNIRYDNPADSLDRWDLRKEALAQVVLDQHPHMVGLQESLAHQLHYLDGQWPGYKRYGVGRDDGGSKGEYSPIYYDTARFTLVEGRTIWLSTTPTEPSKGWDAACERVATMIVLHDKVNGDSLWALNTHWDHVGAQARHYSARLVIELVAQQLIMGHPVVVMGDLNATPDEEPVRYLGQYLMDTCPDDRSLEGTFNGFGTAPRPLPRIDVVLISPIHWSVIRYDVLHPLTNGREVSDHFPLVVEIAR